MPRALRATPTMVSAGLAAATILLASPWINGCEGATGPGPGARPPTDASADGGLDAAPDAAADAPRGAALFAPCVTETECAQDSRGGVDCVDGRCLPVCTMDSECPPPARCAITNVDVGSSSSTVVYHCSDPSTDPCTPLPDSCPAGLSCLVQGSSPELPSYCGSRSGTSATLCLNDQDCPAGTGCRADGTSDYSACETWCDVKASAGCPKGTSCGAFDPPLVLHGTTLGTCRADCDPLKACGGGRNCVIVGSGPSGATDCLPSAAPEACTSGCVLDSACRTFPDGTTLCEPLDCSYAPASCTAGRTCRRHALGEATCEQVCDTAKPGTCGAEQCVPFSPPLVVRGVTYGTCEVACDPLSSQADCGSMATCAVVTDVPGGARTACVSAGMESGPTGCANGADDSCAPGETCAAFELGTSPVYACEPYCRVGHPEDCPPVGTVGQSCVGIVPAAVVAGVQYGTCQDDCDLTSSNATCGTGAECIPVDDGSNPVHTACVAAGMTGGVAGSPCKTAAECAPDTTCTGATCAAWCQLGPSGHCAPGTTCTAMTPPLTLGAISYGVCL